MRTRRGERAPGIDGTFPAPYEFRVEGRLTPRSAIWFEGMSVTVDAGEVAAGSTQTVIRGTVRDRAALFGLVARIRDLGLTLVSVNRLERGG